MNAIPLTAPDGTVYAYACGRCHRVAGGVHTTDATSPVARLAGYSLGRAARCCVCRCGAPVRVALWHTTLCDACHARDVAETEARIAARDAARAADLAARGMRECVPCRGFGCDDRADEECPDCDGTGEVPL